jgi:hypothetical protein
MCSSGRALSQTVKNDHTVAETAGELTGLVEGYLGGNARRGI